MVLNYEYPPLGGGASPVAHEINKRYVEHGHQVTVVTMHFKGLPHHEVVDGVHVVRVKCWRSKKHMSHPWEQLSFLMKARSVLKRILQAQKIDVCHTHFLLPTAILSKWIKREYRIPYIVTIHGSDVPGYNPDRFQLLHRITPPLIKSICDHSAKIVSPSNYLAQLLETAYSKMKGQIAIIPNGIDPDHFVPKQKDQMIMSTGRLLQRKGFHHLAEAFSSIETDFTLHICGDGPMMETIRQIQESSRNEIVLHGWIDGRSESYQDLLGKSAIYCLVSEKENASISLLEAMSAGCAVITSNISGCPETVSDAGICISPSDISELRTAILNLLNDPEKIKDYGERARRRIVNELSWEKIYAQYEAELYTAIES